jgi:ribose/xylose/arabinose/galactoside ABC-type transport system permease subunit
MIKRLDLKYTAVGLAIAVIIGALISWFSSLPFWASFAIVVVSMVLNGVLAEYEDNRPGGFNNPMSGDQIKIENDKRKKRLLPIRILIWGVFVFILTWLVWLYTNRSV